MQSRAYLNFKFALNFEAEFPLNSVFIKQLYTDRTNYMFLAIISALFTKLLIVNAMLRVF